eukprot:s602_g2.t1
MSMVMLTMMTHDTTVNVSTKREVQLGIIPYYMFLARDTGAQEYFSVPLARAHQLYADAIRQSSGLARTARGPSMSCTPGKVEISGIEIVNGQKAFVMRFLQCRDPSWIGRVFFAKYIETAIWFDELEPLGGGSVLPWDGRGTADDARCSMTSRHWNPGFRKARNPTVQSPSCRNNLLSSASLGAVRVSLGHVGLRV